MHKCIPFFVASSYCNRIARRGCVSLAKERGGILVLHKCVVQRPIQESIISFAKLVAAQIWLIKFVAELVAEFVAEC